MVISLWKWPIGRDHLYKQRKQPGQVLHTCLSRSRYQGRPTTLGKDYRFQLNREWVGIPPKMVVVGWGVCGPSVGPDKWLEEEDNEGRRMFHWIWEFLALYISKRNVFVIHLEFFLHHKINWKTKIHTLKKTIQKRPRPTERVLPT